MALTVKAKATGNDARKVARAFHEVHENTPRIVTQTAKKSGKAQAEKQRVAIALSKARQAGASIPDKSGSNFVSNNDLHTPAGVTGQGTTSLRRGGERVKPSGQETSFKNASDSHNYVGHDAYVGDRFPVLRMGEAQVTGELDDMHVKPVARTMNPVEALRKKNNATRDARTNLGRGKAGVVVSNEEAAADSAGRW